MPYDERLAQRLRDLLAKESGVTETRLMGGLTFLVDGNMAVSASGRGGLLLRVEPDKTAKLVMRPHARPLEMRGREVAGWVRVDPGGFATDEELADWVALGVAYARSLGPKT